MKMIYPLASVKQSEKDVYNDKAFQPAGSRDFPVPCFRGDWRPESLRYG
jgi:hypothetical protein